MSKFSEYLKDADKSIKEFKELESECKDTVEYSKSPFIKIVRGYYDDKMNVDPDFINIGILTLFLQYFKYKEHIYPEKEDTINNFLNISESLVQTKLSNLSLNTIKYLYLKYFDTNALNNLSEPYNDEEYLKLFDCMRKTFGTPIKEIYKNVKNIKQISKNLIKEKRMSMSDEDIELYFSKIKEEYEEQKRQNKEKAQKLLEEKRIIEEKYKTYNFDPNNDSKYKNILNELSNYSLYDNEELTIEEKRNILLEHYGVANINNEVIESRIMVKNHIPLFDIDNVLNATDLVEGKIYNFALEYEERIKAIKDKIAKLHIDFGNYKYDEEYIAIESALQTVFDNYSRLKDYNNPSKAEQEYKWYKIKKVELESTIKSEEAKLRNSITKKKFETEKSYERRVDEEVEELTNKIKEKFNTITDRYDTPFSILDDRYSDLDTNFEISRLSKLRETKELYLKNFNTLYDRMHSYLNNIYGISLTTEEFSYYLENAYDEKKQVSLIDFYNEILNYKINQKISNSNEECKKLLTNFFNIIKDTLICI